MLLVREVVDIVREWVDRDARRMPGFAGAYLWGGITALPADAPFALYRDVDVVVVSSADVPDDDAAGEELYRGLMLEIITLALAAHRDAEAVLANPSQAPNIAATQILADPLGILAPLQRRVAAEFAQARWVRARCEREKANAQEQLRAMRQVSIAGDGIDHLWSLLNALSGLLAVARLRRPTTRRTLSLLRELLLEQERPDLHQAALVLWGSAGMDRFAVETFLAQCTVAFDRACEVYSTPIPYGFTLRPHLRPYLVQASQEMIDEGQHREAVYWIMAVGGESYRALLNDAPEREKPVFAAELQAVHAALGYTTPAAWTSKVQAAERLTQAIFRIADAIVARLPD